MHAHTHRYIYMYMRIHTCIHMSGGFVYLCICTCTYATRISSLPKTLASFRPSRIFQNKSIAKASLQKSGLPSTSPRHFTLMPSVRFVGSPPVNCLECLSCQRFLPRKDAKPKKQEPLQSLMHHSVPALTQFSRA